MTARPLTHYAWLSIGAALVTMALKALAWWVTGSVGLLSDALESGVNLAGSVMALTMLTIAARPPDAGHEYGHGKAEYFSSAFEGFMIAVAALGIMWTAIPRLLRPEPLESVGIGLAVSAVATIINLTVARILLRAAREHRSIALEGDGRHLMSDVLTSLGVIAGVGLVALTGWLRLDAIVALAVAVNVLWTGWKLVQRSAMGLMDAAIEPEEQRVVGIVLDRFRDEDIDFHALRTRRAGRHAFISMHVLVPGNWTVKQGHDLCERIEIAMLDALPHARVFTHLEPAGDPASELDVDLDRREARGAQGTIA